MTLERDEQNQGTRYEDDPIGYLRERNDQLEGLAREVIVERQLGTVRQQLNSAVTHMANEYEKEAPDFRDAFAYAAEKELSRYKAAGLDDYSARQRLEQDLENLSISELRAQRNPAAKLYEIAQSMGYGTAEAEPKPERALPDLDDEQFQKYWTKLQDRGYPGGRTR